MNARKGVLRYLEAACGPVSPLFPALGHDVSRLIWLHLDKDTMCRMRRVCTAWFMYIHHAWPFPWMPAFRSLDYIWFVFPPVSDLDAWVRRIVPSLPGAIQAELMFLERAIRNVPDTDLELQNVWAEVGASQPAPSAFPLALVKEALRRTDVKFRAIADCNRQRQRVWKWALKRYVPRAEEESESGEREQKRRK
jgi:hypothetical protein